MASDRSTRRTRHAGGDGRAVRGGWRARVRCLLAPKRRHFAPRAREHSHPCKVSIGPVASSRATGRADRRAKRGADWRRIPARESLEETPLLPRSERGLATTREGWLGSSRYGKSRLPAHQPCRVGGDGAWLGRTSCVPRGGRTARNRQDARAARPLSGGRDPRSGGGHGSRRVLRGRAR
jgi:hypothetical protein